MKIKTLAPRGPISGPVRRLQDEVRRLRPVRTSNTRLTMTSAGVARVSLARPVSGSGDDSSTVARWA